jgi:cell division protein YceG involved in septum cleavage
MDKKNKIIIIICVIVIVVGIGVATSIAIIKNNREKIDISNDQTIEIEKNEVDNTPDYDQEKDVNEMTDDELENLI